MKNKIKERLSDLMAERNITAYKISKDLNISKSVLHYWLNGKTTPNVEYLIDLSIYFNVTTDFLLGLETEDGTKINPTGMINNTFNNYGQNNGTINFNN